MKKLNRKGFTLVELLAVIIILAIVVGITIPAVLSTVNSSKDKAFQTAAETAADWLDRQYQSYMIGDTSVSAVDSNYLSQCVTSGTAGDCSTSDGLITSAGLKTTNVSSLTATFSNGRYCVTITAKTGGDYAGLTDNTKKGGNC